MKKELGKIQSGGTGTKKSPSRSWARAQMGIPGKMKDVFILIAVAAIFSTCSLSVHAADDKQAQKMFDKLLAAQLAENYDAFVADANDRLKGALSKTQFDSASTAVKKRLIGGYKETFLGELNQRGYQVFLYRLRPKDGGDDLLGTMSLKNDKVAGIYFR